MFFISIFKWDWRCKPRRERGKSRSPDLKQSNYLLAKIIYRLDFLLYLVFIHSILIGLFIRWYLLIIVCNTSQINLNMPRTAILITIRGALLFFCEGFKDKLEWGWVFRQMWINVGIFTISNAEYSSETIFHYNPNNQLFS